MNAYQQGLLDQCKQQNGTECVIKQNGTNIIAVPFSNTSSNASPLLTAEDCKSKAKRVASDQLWWFTIVVILAYALLVVYLSEKIKDEEIDPVFGAIQGSVIVIIAAFWFIVVGILLLIVYIILYFTSRSKWMKQCVDAKGTFVVPEKSTAHKIFDFFSRTRRV